MQWVLIVQNSSTAYTPYAMHITVRTDDGRVIPIVAESATIGSSRDCDISFSNSDLDDVHAQLRRLSGRWLVEGSGSAKIAVGDQSPARMVWLKAGDVVRLSPRGPTLEFCPPDPNPVSKEPAKALAPESQSEPQSQSTPRKEPRGDDEVASAARSEVDPPSVPHRDNGQRREWTQFAKQPVFLSAVGGVSLILVILLIIWNRKGADSAGRSARGDGNTAQSAVAKSDNANRSAKVADERLKQRQDTNRKSVVWIGVEIEGTRFALCSGCAVGPKHVLSSADIVSQFAEGKKALGKAQFFVYCPNRKPPFVNIEKARIHPRYLKAKPGDIARRHYNVAMLALEERLEHYSRLADDKGVSGLRNGATVLQIGFSFPQNGSREYQKGNPPRLIETTGTIAQANSEGIGDDIPMLTLELAAPARSDGSPVFNQQGYLIGVLSEVGGKHFAASSPRARELLTIVRAESD